MLTENSVRIFTHHIGSQSHAMAGAAVAASAGLGCSLGEACVRISAGHMTDATACAVALELAERLTLAGRGLLILADEDGEAITAFATARKAGQELPGRERLCELPVEMGDLAAQAGLALQAFRPSVIDVQDDLEMAITLLAGAARAAILLLESNLRLWPDAPLLERFEPELARLRGQAAGLRPAERLR